MTITYLEAKTAKTLAQLRTLTLAALTGTPVAGWSANAPQRLLVDDFAARMSEETTIRAALAAMVDLDDLAALAVLDRDWCRVFLTWFDEVYIPALPAYWDIEFTVTSSAAPLTIDASSTIQIQASGGAIFLLEQLSVTALNAGSSYKGTLRFVARAAGTGGNVAPSTILAGKILTGPSGLSIGPSTPALFTAGRDEETPIAAITRALAKWSTLGAGWTLDAFDYLIPRFAPTVTRWRVRDDNPLGPGTVAVRLANAAGPATPTEVALVLAGLGARDVKPLGSGALSVLAAVAAPLTVTSTIALDGSNAAAVTEANAALLALGNSYSLGPATFYVDQVVEAIMAVASVYNIVTLSLSSDYDIADAEVLVVTPAITEA